jgi:predicted dehydrogenase
MDRAVFGIIGAGGIAQSQHLPNLTRAPHVRLKTICDLRADVVAEMQKKYAIPNSVMDHGKLLADPEIQAVVVATREDHQAPLTIEALRAGKHVYVEKPLANTAGECAAVVEAQKKAGKFVAVGFNRRFAPAYRKVREVLWADGGPKNIHYRIADEYWRWGAAYPPGVRVIHELGHIFDFLRWLTRSEVESVYVIQSRADDEVYALRFRSGCVASIMNSGQATFDLPKERLEAIGTRGGLTVEDFVELRTFGHKAYPAVLRFPGHTHPDREYSQKYLFEKGGAEVLYDLRRVGWELREGLAGGYGDQTPPDAAERKKYLDGTCPNWNYMVDKGWLWAMDHFAQCVLTGETPENASAADGLAASLLSHASIRSRDKNEIVRF